MTVPITAGATILSALSGKPATSGAASGNNSITFGDFGAKSSSTWIIAGLAVVAILAISKK